MTFKLRPKKRSVGGSLSTSDEEQCRQREQQAQRPGGEKEEDASGHVGHFRELDFNPSSMKSDWKVLSRDKIGPFCIFALAAVGLEEAQD